MLEIINHIDSEIFLFFNGWHTPFLDRFMMLFTGRFIWIPMYATILFILLRTFKPKLVAVYILAIALAITLTDQTCATIIRPIVERMRPSNLQNPLSELAVVVNGYRGGAYGFPSCHAANSFALAVFMSLLIPRRRFVFFIFGWAVFNSYSRLYLGVHYPGDLFVGAVIGSAFGYGCYRLAHLFDSLKRDVRLERTRRPIFPRPVMQVVGIRLQSVISVADMTIGVGLFTSLIILTHALVIK